MIIDVHAHFTTVPPADDPSVERFERSLEPVIRQMDERGIDVLLFSPRAATMGHAAGEAESRRWTTFSNDRIARAAALHPDRLVPVAQLPQAPGLDPAGLLDELERCAAMGFVGVVVNPDPSGGLPPFAPSLADPWWYPLWRRLAELRMPALVHASATSNPALPLHGAQYIAYDHAVVVELAASRVFDEVPGLRLIVPHGGGGIPFQYGRQRALHARHGLPPFDEAIRQLWFDTAVYDQEALDLLVARVGVANVLFGSEMFGTAQAVDPATGRPFDDILPLVRAIPGLSAGDLAMILEGNARTLFPRAASAFDRRAAGTRP